MRNLKSFIALVALTFISMQFVHGQSAAGLPKASDLKVPEDYPKYKDAVLKCIDWLETTPVDPESKERKEVNKFIMKWITGQNEIRMYMDPSIMEHTKGNPDLTVIYLAGVVKYSLAHPGETDKEKLNLAGAHEMIKVYKANTGIKKDQKMENMAAMDENKKLDKYFAQQQPPARN